MWHYLCGRSILFSYIHVYYQVSWTPAYKAKQHASIDINDNFMYQKDS